MSAATSGDGADCGAAAALTERFVSADCAGCWQSEPPAARHGGQPAAAPAHELVLDWIVPGGQGSDAPLAIAALPEAGSRAGRDRPSADEPTVRHEPINARPGLQLTVEDGPAWNGYIGLRLVVESLSRRALPPGSVGWLALAEEIPAGEDGSPVDRRLVRALVGPLPLGSLAVGRPVEHLRAVRVPETPRPERLRAIGWVETDAGRPLAARLRPAAACDGSRPAPPPPTRRSQR